MLTAATAAGKRVSGLQHDVFALYRAILRAARRKDSGTYQLARAQFREDVSACVRGWVGRSLHHVRWACSIVEG